MPCTDDFDENVRWYHGGPVRLARDGWILPATRSGVEHKNRYLLGGKKYRPSRVYVTYDLNFAVEFAIKVPNRGGAVFEVEPVGELELDEGCASFERYSAYTCEKAKIKRRLKNTGKLMKRARKKHIELLHELTTAGVFSEEDPALQEEKIKHVAERLAEKRVRAS